MSALAAVTQAKLADNWADHAILRLAAVKDMAGWIVANRNHLHKCDQLNPSAFQRVKAAIAVRWDEIEGVG